MKTMILIFCSFLSIALIGVGVLVYLILNCALWKILIFGIIAIVYIVMYSVLAWWARPWKWMKERP